MPQQESPVAVEERCSLCGDARDQVDVMVEAFEGLYVCDDCIAVLNELLDDARARRLQNATHVMA